MKLINNDCILAMKELPDNSVDAIVTDPPYELGFMGKSWDASGIAFNVDVWREALRVLKPGGHLLAFSGSRTYHRMAVAIEDAGFEIRDQIMWIYGSGFPKSLDIAKSIEAKLTTGSANKTAFKNLQGEQVERGNWGLNSSGMAQDYRPSNYDETAGETRLGKLEPTTKEAKKWQGWGTALKPAHEPIVLARKPLIGTVAANVLEYGTGGLNIDGTRVGTEVRKNNVNDFSNQHGNQFGNGAPIAKLGESEVIGRWPANVIHDGSDEVVELFPDSKGMATQKSSPLNIYGGNSLTPSKTTFPKIRQGFNDLGSAARFFYCAKASKRDRNEGLDGFKEIRTGALNMTEQGSMLTGSGNERTTIRANHHPTVKPTDLMRYLCRLITPPNGVVLDPFMGSGSTGKACVYEGFDFIGIDQSAEYMEIARARIKFAEKDLGLFGENLSSSSI